VSRLLIQHYLNELQTLRRVSGTSRESVVREAFKTLLKDWGRSRDLIFLPEYEYQTLQKTRVRPDGTLLHALRVPLGYWEAKDEADDLDEEIEKKFRKGYPQDNIIFEDSHEAVLIQNKQPVMRCGVEDPSQLQKLLELFFGYERAEIADFRKAVEQFKNDLPEVLKALREMIERAEREGRGQVPQTRAGDDQPERHRLSRQCVQKSAERGGVKPCVHSPAFRADDTAGRLAGSMVHAALHINLLQQKTSVAIPIAAQNKKR
jgi:hypothetical protein